MPIEEIWLDENDQLVSIDRGAFWDLIYFKRLSLRLNPMLMSINSQAFVGTQSLQFIDVEGCQSLDSTTKQMLENITMAATSRLLRLEQLGASKASSQQQQATAIQVNSTGSASVHSPPVVLLGQLSSQPNLSVNQLIEKQQQQQNRLNYAYYLATMALLVVALKLILKYTSSNHYLRHRRRRRRVYEASSTSNSLSQHEEGCLSGKETCSGHFEAQIERSSSSSSLADMNAYPMCDINSNEQRVSVSNFNQDESVLGSSEQQQQQQASGSYSSFEVVDLEHQDNWAESQPDAASDSIEELETQNETQIPSYCPDCPQAGEQQPESPSGHHQEPSNGQASGETNYDLFQRQLLAAGLDYGHANCAHFYQSLGPALQFADMTANYMHDYYS